MIKYLRLVKYILISIIIIVGFITLIFVIDGYILNPKIKGISLLDLKQIGVFLGINSLLIFIIILIEKSVK